MRPNFSFLECIMFTLNEVTLLGRLGSDAKVRTAANGKKYAMISLATEEVFRDDQGGWATTTVWHDLIVFPSDAVLQHLKKGACALVKAAVSYRTEENSNRKLMNLKVRQLQVQASGGAKSQNRTDGDNAQGYSGSYQRNGNYRTQNSQNVQRAQQAPQQRPVSDDDFV